MPDKLQKLKSVIALLNEGTVTPKVLGDFLQMVLKTIKENKDEFQTISNSTLSNLQKSLDYIEREHMGVLDSVDKKNDVISKQMKYQMAQIQKMCQEVMDCKPENGKDGKDADEEMIIESVLSKMPDPVVLDNAGQIRDKLETLKDEDRLDASAIKNLPEFIKEDKRIGFGSMLKEAPKDGLIYGRQNRAWVEVTTGGGTWGSITGTLSDQIDLQAALDAKQNTITGAATTITSLDLTANRAVISNGSGKIAVSSVTSTELGYLSGVTSAIQTQLNNKWSITGNSGTTAGTNFLGTTDDVDVVFKRNSLEQARFLANNLRLTTASGTYTINSGAATDTIILGVTGATSNSKLTTSQSAISMLYTGTTPSIVSGITADQNGLTIHNGGLVNWYWPLTDSTGTQALVSDGSGNLSWATMSSGTVTSVDASGGTTGLTFSGGPITTSGTLTLAGTLALANGGTGTTTGLPINNLIAATGTNTINNADYAQEWQWNSLTTQNALTLSSSALTTGKLVNITSASTGILTNTGLLNVSYTGTPSNAGQTTVAINGSNSAVGNTNQTRIGVRGSASGGTLFAGGGTGYGGYFTSTVVGNYNYGVYAAATGNNNNISAGGYFVGSGSNTTNAGVYATSTGTGGYGVYAVTSHNVAINVGVYGQATTGLNTSSSTGGKFIASSAGSSTSYGVWGQAVTTGVGGTAYGGYFSTTGVSANNIAGYFTASGGTNNYGIIVANGRTGFGITTPTAFVHEVQPVSTTGSPTALLVAGGAHTTLTASTEATDVNINLARTVQFATGALTTQRAVFIQAPTYGFVGASTITTAATVAISGAPVQGTNATLSATHALLIEAGAVSTATASYGLTVNAQTGATANYTAALLGGNVGIGTSTPNSTLHVEGSTATAYVAKTANYTLDATDFTVNCTANTFDITFPTAVGIEGRIYVVKNVGTGVITLKTTSAQTIDGNASGVLTLVQWDSIMVQSDNANWIIIN